MASFWDRIKRGLDRLSPGGVGRNHQQRSNSSRSTQGSGSSSRFGNSSSKSSSKSTGGNSKYTGGPFTNMPRNLMSDKAKREAGTRAQGARYTAQAKAAGKKIHPSTGVYVPGVGYTKGGAGGGGGVGGGDIFEDMLAQMGLGANYQSPEFDVQQIDVAATLAAMFDPQFSAIKKAEGNAKSQHKKSDASVKAAFDALAKELKTEGTKSISQTYDKAEKDNTSTAKSVNKDLRNTISKQSREDMEMAAALGIASALDGESSGRGELNKAIADVSTSTKDANERLNELETIDKQANRDSITVAQLSGEGHRAELDKQVASILAGLGDRRVDTTTAKANKRADLEAQNQSAVNQANAMEAQAYQEWSKGQNDLAMSAAQMQLDRAKMQNDLDIAGLRSDTSIYGYDSRADTAMNSALSRAAGGSGSNSNKGTPLQQLLAQKPEGLSTGNLMGIVNNLTDLNTTGDWGKALAQYHTKYPKSQRSRRAAEEYVRLLKGGR